MKKLVVILLVAVLFVFSFIFVFNNTINKPIFENNKDVRVYLDGIKDDNYKHIYINNQIYISSKYLLDNELLDFYWDKDYSKISIFNNFSEDDISYNNNKAFFNKNPYNRDELIVIENDELYFNVKFLSDNYIPRLYADINNLNVVIEINIREYEVVKKTRLKSSSSSRSGTLQKLDINEHIYVYGNEHNGWILARTDETVIGYVKLLRIKPISKTNYISYNVVNNRGKIRMAWDLVYKQIDKFESFKIPNTIDIIAPTWYELEDTENIFKDLSNSDYIKHVKSLNKKVWGVFNNSFDPKLTSELLNDAIKRNEIVDKIIEITINNDFDAINVDFENIYLKDKDVFSVFIKELYCRAKEKGIMLTVDITILSNAENWSLCYDRKVISKYSDYIMLMAYDENVSGVAGSVSSIPWVKYGVNNILEYAPSEKIVLSIPFYTRLWEMPIESPLEVKATALKINSSIEAIKELGINLVYDETTGQNYGERTVEGITYKIWNEDETSLRSRLDIIRSFDLSGYAVWAFRYGTDEMWSILE